MVFIISDVLDQLIKRSESKNEESCGFLFGKEKEDNIFIEDCLLVENSDNQNKKTRYSISARDYLLAENVSNNRQLSILGIFHSHCNSAAEMSSLDIKHSFPGFIYLILSLKENKFDHFKVWLIGDNQDYKEINKEII